MPDRANGSDGNGNNIVDRRSVLRGLGATGILGLAGCTGGTGGSDGGSGSAGNDAGSSGGSSGGGDGATAGNAGGGADTITLGGILPLTGGLADPAMWIKRAWNVKVDEMNSDGGLLGKQLKLKVYDSELDKTKMRTLTSKLLDVDNVDLFLGPYPTITMPVIAPLLERAGMTVMHMFWPRSVILDYKNGNGKWPHQFGFSAGAYTYPRAFSKFLGSLPQSAQPKNVAFMGRSDLYGHDSFKSWKEFLGKNAPNVEIVASEYFSPGTSDLSNVARKLKSHNPEMVASNSYMGGSILAMKAIADVGMHPKFIWANVGPQIPSWISALGGTGQYVYGCAPYSYSVPTDANKKLAQTAQDKWNQKPNYSFGFGYMQLQMYEQAIKKNGSLDQDAMAKAFESMQFDVVTGKIGFDHHFSNAPMFATQVQGKDISIVWPDKYQTKKPVYPLPDKWPNA